MKSRILAGSAAAALFLMTAASAQAVVLTFTAPSTSTSAAETAEDAFLTGLLPGYLTESFEGISASRTTTYISLISPVGVGTFTQVSTGLTSGSCNQVNNCVGLAVLDSTTSPFSGRFALPPGNNWLDSNDSPEMRYDVAPGYRAVGFFLTDPNDNFGRLTITGLDGTSAAFSLGDIFGTSLGDGRVSYLTVSDPNGIATLTFLANTAGDGYGIDRVSVGDPVPEPGTLLLLGSGISALALRRRRKA